MDAGCGMMGDGVNVETRHALSICS